MFAFYCAKGIWLTRSRTLENVNWSARAAPSPRRHAQRPRTTSEVKRLRRACGADLAGVRDRALFLLGFAGAMRRSELVGLDVGHVTWTTDGLQLLTERSKTDAEGEGAEIAIPRDRVDDTCRWQT